MGKGISTKIILLVVIGVIAASLALYLIYVYVDTSALSETQCIAKLSEACNLCKNYGWGGFPSRQSFSPFFETIDKCADYPKFRGFRCGRVPPEGCNACAELENPCKMLNIQ